MIAGKDNRVVDGASRRNGGVSWIRVLPLVALSRQNFADRVDKYTYNNASTKNRLQTKQDKVADCKDRSK